MSTKPRIVVGLAAAIVMLSMLANSVRAQGPDRVPRFMITNWVPINWESPAPLDWDAEGSVAMVVMPKLVQTASLPIRFGTPCDEAFPPDESPEDPDVIYSAIVNTLETNLAERISAGEITEAEISLIADMLYDALDGAQFRCYREVLHVAKGRGAERLTGVYFDSLSLPPQGAMAEAGPDGDVLVLGEFWLHELGVGSICNPANAEVFVVTDRYSIADYKAQFAIGWFTK